MNRLANKIIIVTGGSGLIGKSIFQDLKAKGALALNADINCTDDLDQGCFQCDITKEESIQRLIDHVVNKFGRIDGLVNNAYPRTADWGNRFEDISIDSWKTNVDWQMNSCFVFCQKVLVQMKEQQYGSIVNIGSTYGVVSPDFTIYEGTALTSAAAYTAIKGGIINFTRYLASYFGKYNIRVNCVSPGGIFDNQNEIFVRNYKNKVPMKRMGSPKDIAGPVSFLLSDEASYITGHNLLVDGGWTCI